MPLERLLQINMAALAALGALLLGMGARTQGPPLLVIVAAALSVWLTDVTKRLVIGRRLSTAMMLVAAVIALQQLFWIRNELQALSFAWLVIFLQIVLFFQRKDGRTYWLLIVLSLLQVVVATLFSQGVWFGLLLALYMLLGFAALALLLMYRQWESFGQNQLAEFIVPRSDVARTPGVAMTSELVGYPAESGEAAWGPALFRRLAVMGTQTLGLTLVLFFALPRLGQFSWQGNVANPQPVTGFSEKVELGELGELVESREEVMRVRFERLSDNSPEPVSGDIYLQGALLVDYQRGQWKTGQPTTRPGATQLLKETRPSVGVIRQRITIEGMDHDELFFVSPYLALRNIVGIDIDLAHEKLCRNPFLRNKRFEYSLGTTAFVRGQQSPLTPALEERKDITVGVKARPARGPGGLPNLVALADRWIKESRLPAEDRVGRARYLERKLSDSGQFQYSLVGQDRDPTIDPIEDFLTKHPQGHCEYFATALTLMLRSQGIPARMVVGYKVDHEAWDPLGNYYLVRQLHAHTWVEAYLRANQTPDELMHGGDHWRWRERGAWLRLDPTPAGVTGERANWFTPIRQSMDWLNSAWSNYFVELDCQRQRDAIYQPIANAAQALWQMTVNRCRAIFSAASVARYLKHLNREVVWIVLIVAGLLAAVTVAAAGWFAVWLGRRLLARWSGKRLPRRHRVDIEFYRRFESLLARQGLVRPPNQTQREFAASAGARLAESDGDGRLPRLAEAVAEAFYRVRFGRLPLDNLQAETVEQALAEIAENGHSSAARRRK